MKTDSVTLVYELLKDAFGATFTTYYNGDPEAIPSFNLPALIIDQTGDDTIGGAFQEDDVTDHVVVKVVLDKRDDFDGDLVKPLNTTAKKIRDYIGKIDPKTGTYANGTVKYVIRHALFKGVTILANDMKVDYGIATRVAGEGLADLTAEGHVAFDITHIQRTDI